MNNPFKVGDLVKHTVKHWVQPEGVLRVILIRNLIVVAVADNGKKFVGSYGCFCLVVKGECA